MFNRKLKEKVERLELRIKRLECNHVRLKFVPVGQFDYVFDENGKQVYGWFDVRCEKCGKPIDTVRPEEKARMEYEQAKKEYNRVCGGGE